jgi:site-specific DNA-methyltransferase (adenine-specific)
MKIDLRCGDALALLREMPQASVDAVVTDPPYGLRFMGKEWDHGIPGVAYWTEALRVAKPGAHLLAFGGTRTFHRLACAIEDAGWEIRDCLMWLYGSGFPKSHNLDGERKGWGTALKPAWEPIIMARKPLVGTVAANMTWYGTGALNVDGCRVGVFGGTRAGEPRGNGDVPMFGTGSVRDCKVESINAGRWPANVVHDGSEEVVGRFPDADGMAVNDVHRRGATTGRGLGYNSSSPSTPAESVGYGDSGSASRFFKEAKWTAEDVSVAEQTSFLPSQLGDSAQSIAATAPEPTGSPVTPDSTAGSSTSTQPLSNAGADGPESIGTIPTTPSPSTSCGFAHRATDANISQDDAVRAAEGGAPVSGTRFLYCPKASRGERNAGLDGMAEGRNDFQRESCGMSKGRNERNGGPPTPHTPLRNHHPTVKPVALMQWLCRLVTPPAGVILDPFMGSGSTGIAADREGCSFIGFDLSPEYVEIARRRIAADCPLFAQEQE